MARLKICILFGGVSPEHEISLMSAKNVIDGLNKSKYEIYPVGITKKGEWFLYSGDIREIATGEWENDNDNKSNAILSPDRTHKGLIVIKDNKIKNLHCDLIFPVLHGTNGEDGTIQGLIQISGIPLVGPELLPSCVCMNKILTKMVLNDHGIPQAKFVGINKSEIRNSEKIVNRIENEFDYPIFIKPSASGSSVGAHIVHNNPELLPAIRDALKYDDIALVEEYIKGHDFECAMIGNEEVIVSGIGEILSGNEFYDYKAKYTDGVSNVLVKARLDQDKIQRMQEMSKKAYKALYLNGFCRADFMIEEKSGRILLNEINTIPGCTKYSLFPSLFAESGIEWTRLLDKLIFYALERANISKCDNDKCECNGLEDQWKTNLQEMIID